MKKRRITQREVKATHTAVIRIGYRTIQRLFKHEQPYAYTAGVYGWNADIYSFGNVAIVTGYSAFGDITPPFELVATYETKAFAIDEGGYTWEERKQLKRKLISEFIEEVRNS